MNSKDIVSGIVMLILIYLLVTNGSKTAQVINALAQGGGTLVSTLQGRDSGNSFGNVSNTTFV